MEPLQKIKNRTTVRYSNPTSEYTFKRIEIIKSMSSLHNRNRLQINNKKISGKLPNTWKL